MKHRVFIIVMTIIFLVSCAKNLTTENATTIIKNTLRLTDNDKVEILGISKESNTVMLVKFKVDDTQVNSKMRKYDKGWQLEEIQNELGLWIPASSVTNLFNQSDKILVAMKEINIITTALVDYITDNGVAPEHSGTIDIASPFYITMSYYIKDLPIKDPWGNGYHVYCGQAIEGKYGLTGLGADDILVLSYGKDGKQELWKYDPSNPEAGLFLDSDYDRDLINWSGSWIRAPKTPHE